MENREVNQAPCLYAEIISLSTFKDKLKNFLLLNTLVFGLAASVQAEGLKNKEFLDLPATHQKFWIQGAMHALGQVASAKSQEQGKCVFDWYFGVKRSERNGLILGSMRKYPDAYPSAIFLALTERECGVYRK